MISDQDFRRMQARLNRDAPRTLGGYHDATDESQLQSDIEAECRHRGWIPSRPRMDVPSTMPVGFPDFVIMAHGGRTIWVEAKARKKKPSTEQLAFRALAKSLGHEHHVVYSLPEFIHAVTNRPDKA